MYLTAAMTVCAKGNCSRSAGWTSTGWPADPGRRNFVRGQFGHAEVQALDARVPLADLVAAELELFTGPAYKADEDLVFGHPHTGSRSIARCCSSASRRR